MVTIEEFLLLGIEKLEFDMRSPFTVVGLSSTEVVYEALVKKGADFAGRPQSHSLNSLDDGGKSIFFGDYNPRWKLHRKLATNALKHYMGGSRLEGAIEDSLGRGFEFIEQQKGPFNPLEAINLIVVNIINSICFGYTCDAADKYFNDVLGGLEEVNDLLGKFYLEDIIPPLRLFPTAKFRKLLVAVDKQLSPIKANIDKHRESFCKDNIRDFCDDVLLAQIEAKEEEDPELLAQITDGHVVQTVKDIFIAGIDTSRNTLLWTLLYLAGHPDVQTKMHQEIDEALGSRGSPKMSDRSNLPYTDAILHEVMRLSSVVPLSLPHKTICDTKIGEFDIPKGTIVMLNEYALHYDPKIWDDPTSFKPERFLDRNGKMAPKPDSWLPFSAGRRVCLGESVAKPELHLLLAGIMRQFKVSVPPGETLTYEAKDINFFRIPKDFKLLFEPRV